VIPLSYPAGGAELDASPAAATVRSAGVRLAHHFTVDVEEYFQVSAFESHVARADWERLESRVAASVHKLLALLARHGAQATFFILGWVAERHPLLVKAIAAAGHEVASHGWDHRRVTQQTPDQLRESVRRTKAVLEAVVGVPVVGFRAPSFSIVPGREWALDVLIEEGYRYDSSLFPVRRRGYGYPRGPRDPYVLNRPAGPLLELPPATLRRWGVNWPAGGGAYFRLLPYALIRAALRDYTRRGVSATFYIHPWEVDPDQPRLPASWTSRARHYSGLDRTCQRLERLLSEFRFTSVAARGVVAALGDCGAVPAGPS
jgi:polysaccharide deacetylase family protein (PEP-CTERM system associated)